KTYLLNGYFFINWLTSFTKSLICSVFKFAKRYEKLRTTKFETLNHSSKVFSSSLFNEFKNINSVFFLNNILLENSVATINIAFEMSIPTYFFDNSLLCFKD